MKFTFEDDENCSFSCFIFRRAVYFSTVYYSWLKTPYWWGLAKAARRRMARNVVSACLIYWWCPFTVSHSGSGSRDVKFWVRVRRVASAKLNRQASATAFALPATMMMLKINCFPKPALTNVACAKTANASGILYYYCYQRVKNFWQKVCFWHGASASTKKNQKLRLRRHPQNACGVRTRVSSVSGKV